MITKAHLTGASRSHYCSGHRTAPRIVAKLVKWKGKEIKKAEFAPALQIESTIYQTVCKQFAYAQTLFGGYLQNYDSSSVKIGLYVH